jgi:MtN3 and saliva related transmembrane protein
MIDLIEIVGLIAGLCTTMAFLPQVIKVWQHRSTKDISLMMYIIFCFGVALWFFYGFFVGSLALLLANAVTFILAFFILLMKIKNLKKEESV